MSDLLKEFKMTDLLGMMMPGIVVVLLFGWEYELWAQMSERTVFPKGDVFLSVVVIVAGYAVGMLIHELSDWIEKYMWCDSVIDPRTQAVVSSRYLSLRRCNVKLKTDIKIQQDLRAEIVCTGSVFALLGVATGIALGFKGYMLSAIAGLFGYAFLRGVMEYRLTRLCKQIGGDQGQAKALALLVRRDNSLLTYRNQAQVYGTEEYERMILRKHDLFDGFRTMARNTLVTVLLLANYGAMSNGNIAKLFHNVREDKGFLWLTIVTMILLAVRFYHYTYLRYKYIYEDAGHPICRIRDQQKP